MIKNVIYHLILPYIMKIIITTNNIKKLKILNSLLYKMEIFLDNLDLWQKNKSNKKDRIVQNKIKKNLKNKITIKQTEIVNKKQIVLIIKYFYTENHR